MSSNKSNLVVRDNKRWIVYAVLAATLSWLALWGIIHVPVSGATKVFFLIALFFAVTSTLMPAIAYLNARFGGAVPARVYRLRFVRQSGQIGLFVTVVAWLQMQRVLDLTITLILIGVFALVETFLITRDTPSGPP